MAIKTSRRRPARSRAIGAARKTPKFDYAHMRKDARISALGSELNTIIKARPKNLVRFPVIQNH